MHPRPSSTDALLERFSTLRQMWRNRNLHLAENRCQITGSRMFQLTPKGVEFVWDFHATAANINIEIISCCRTPHSRSGVTKIATSLGKSQPQEGCTVRAKAGQMHPSPEFLPLAQFILLKLQRRAQAFVFSILDFVSSTLASSLVQSTGKGHSFCKMASQAGRQ